MEPELSKKTPDPLAPNPRSPLSAERLLLAGLLVFTVVVRGSVLWMMRENMQQDPDAYREIAENLLRHGEFALGKPSGTGAGGFVTPTAYRPPLYPVVLSNLPTAEGRHVSLLKVGLLHLVLGVASVWLTYATARRFLSAGPSGLVEDNTRDMATPALRPGLLPAGPPGLTIAPLISGLIVACDPILLNQQTLIMTETLAAFLAVLALWCLARFDTDRSWFNATLAGGAMGLAVLCRPTFLPWLGLVGMTMLAVRAGPNFKFQISNFKLENMIWRLANLAGLIVAAGSIMSPWAIRNYRVFGKPIVTTTHGGYTLLLGNNDSFYDWLKSDSTGLPWSDRPLSIYIDWRWALQPESRQNPEVRHDELAYDDALGVIRKRPLVFACACLYRVGQLWSPLPHKLTADESMGRRVLRYATCAWYCGVYVLAAIGIWRLRSRLFASPLIWGVLLCFAFTAVHTFYWTNLRMRAPLMPFVAMVAAAAMPVQSSKFKVRLR